MKNGSVVVRFPARSTTTIDAVNTDSPPSSTRPEKNVNEPVAMPPLMAILVDPLNGTPSNTADHSMVADAIRNGVVERLPPGFVHVNEYEAVGDDHLLQPLAFRNRQEEAWVTPAPFIA